ncbi:transposase, partial [Propionibacterium freudenreichii]|nr:transposase [Propionibacterium freudenreichii]
VPKALVEITKLGRTLKKRAADVLAYFDRPSTSNGPTEAINGRLEHLRGSALGFRNLTNYIARSLLETGGFRPDYTLDSDEPLKGLIQRVWG